MLRFTRMILCSLYLIGIHQTSFAAIPETMDYQGYLADSSGSPVFGPADLTISLYTVETGGTALWTQTVNTFINNGGFAIILNGGNSNPFPGDLFEGALWLGLTVNTDPEMTPRQLLNSAPYSFVAKFAETSGTANNALELKGLDGEALLQIFNNYDFGDGGPSNSDPREGLGDTDGDGIANFLDPDNDNDGITDTLEISRGSDINVISPFVLSVEPGDLTTDGGPIEIFLDNGHPDLQSSSFAIAIAGFSQSGINAVVVDANTLRLDAILPIIPAGLNTLTVTLENTGESTTFGNIQFDPITVAITSSSYITVDGGPLAITLDTNISSLLSYTFTVDVGGFSQSGISPTRIDSSTVQLDVTLPVGQTAGPGLLTATLDGASISANDDVFFNPVSIDIASVSHLTTEGGPATILLDTNLPSSLSYTFTVEIDTFSQSGIAPVWIDSSTVQLDFTLPALAAEGWAPVIVRLDSFRTSDTSNELIHPPLKIVFVTSSSFDGNLGGVSGADAICQGAAGVAGLTGTFRAWLSDDLGNSPNNNFNQSGEFINIDTKIADFWADLVDGTLDNTLDLNEFGGARVSSVWTYTVSSGDANSTGNNCQNWTSNSSGDAGEVGFTQGGWTDSGTEICSSKLPIYCFRD